MYSHTKNKLFVISLAIAVGGILACTGAILGVYMPKGSTAAFVTMMTLVGLTVTGLIVGFMWACDKFESHVEGDLDRLLDPERQGARKGAGPRGRRHSDNILSGAKEHDSWT
ncbi:MAG: hypothetical protein ABR915_06905 [Thermoguttaceae bacterium]|jgi:hypothetical protein